MIEPNDLIAKFQKALSEKWGYILNGAGSVWTDADQNSAEVSYKKAVEQNDQNGINRWEMTAKYGRQWVGRRVSDCSGLFYWAFKQLGGYMYHGQNTMWSKYTTAKGMLNKGKRTDGQELKPGTAVFKVRGDDFHHVGLYIGNGNVIEAQCTRTGVISQKVSSWDTWGELKGVKYSETEKGGAVPMNYQDAVVIADGGVNMRSSPSTNSTKLTVIPKNAVIKAAKFDDEWYAVEYAGKNGYAMAKFISFSTDEPLNDDAIALVENMEKELAKLKALLRA